MTDFPTSTRRLVGFVLSLVMASGFGLLAPLAALADSEAAGLQFIVVSDDIHKTMTSYMRPGSDGESGSADSAENGSGGDNTGHSNNGHGNNADGVDSSNPGQGQGGPNGDVDPSGDYDDEAGGGGASPSHGHNK